MDFLKSIAIAASGLRAQAGRMRIISENIANADDTAQQVAANAYAQLARLTDPGAGLSKALGDAPAGPSFDALVKEALTSVVDAGRRSDAQAQSAASGKANMVDLVTAVAESETAITTLVSVRDRMIQAYQTILQMPI